MSFRLILTAIVLALLTACGPSYQEEKEMSRQQRLKAQREDSAALKVAVTPTLDCLPFYVAEHYGMFDSLRCDIRLRCFTSHIDCDSALENGKVEGAITDIVRVSRLEDRGMRLDYPIATDTYWQLIANKTSRINELRHLDKKMVAMTRHSATDVLVDRAADSALLEKERLFRIQANDVGVRLLMLKNNIVDAVALTEPQATAARTDKNKVLMDTRNLGMRCGVVAFRHFEPEDTARSRQMAVLLKAYDMACDSINKYGIHAYDDIIAQTCGVSDKVVKALPKKTKFKHAAPPKEEDMEWAAKWYKQRKHEDYDI